jgi:hypothetical protein
MSYTKNMVKFSRIYPCDCSLPITSVKSNDKSFDMDLDQGNFVKSTNIKKKPSETLINNNKTSNSEVNYSTYVENYNDYDYYYHNMVIKNK